MNETALSIKADCTFQASAINPIAKVASAFERECIPLKLHYEEGEGYLSINCERLCKSQIEADKICLKLISALTSYLPTENINACIHFSYENHTGWTVIYNSKESERVQIFSAN